MTIALVVLGWLAAAVVGALVWGAFVRAGRGRDDAR
jgi:hypothetical protein